MRLIASIFGRAMTTEAPAGELVRDEEFVDIVLPITDHRFAKDGTLTVTARGRINEQVIAIAVEVGSAWTEQVVDDNALTLYWGSGHIGSTGPESDAFLRLIAHEYGFSKPDLKMAPRTAITMAGLNTDPRNAKTERAAMKVFFEHNGAENYGEAFINVDLANRTLEFRDKDPAYHQGILSSLEHT